MVGTVVGKYRILDRIGRGSMGTVYRAEDKTLHREVAIKVVNADMTDPAADRRFRAEAVAIARLNHPGIAKIYDLFQHDDQWLMAMEFVSGETLESLVTRTGPLSIESACDLVWQSLSALGHAHGMGVVHRDLKPANMMVADGQIKIMDFGIARVAGSERLTSAGLMMGTPAYMAPEQLLAQDIDARTDVFAMGCVLYFLVTAQLPYKGATAMDQVQARLHGDAIPLKDVRPELPEWLGRVIGHALARNPANRFQTADEFRGALEMGIAGRPVEFAPAPAQLPAHLMETMVGVPIASPTPVASSVTVQTPSPAAASEPKTFATIPPAIPSAGSAPVQSGKPKSPKSSSGMWIGVGVAAVVVASAIGWMVVKNSGTTGTTGTTGTATTPVPSATVTPLPTTPATSPTATPSATVTPGPATTGTPAPGSAAAAAAAAAAARGRAGVPGTAASAITTDPPVQYAAVKLLKITKNKGEDVDVTLIIGNGIIVAQRAGADQTSLPYKALLAATYVRDKEPQYSSKYAAPPKDLSLPTNLIFQKPTRNWLVLQGPASFVILSLADDNANAVLKTLTERTHIKVERPAAK